MANIDVLNNIDALNQEVSSAIWIAEGLERMGSKYTSAAYGLVSFAEQRLANEVTCGGMEWKIAWDGAVRAAVKASNVERARNLIEHLKVNFQIGPEFVNELEALLP